MEGVYKNWRVLTATLFAAILVIGAYMLAHGFESPATVEASTETALLQAIATKDSDGDGLPDWEESLYGTDPKVADTFNLGMSDGAAVAKGLIVPKAIADIPSATSTPGMDAAEYAAEGLTPPTAGTLTSAFAQSFFTLYVATKQANGGAALSEEQTSSITNQALTSLSASIAATPDFKSATDIRVSGSGPEALKAFAVNAEAVLLKNTADASTTDIKYLQAALIDNDDTAFVHLESISKMYRGSAAGLAALSVPGELAETDLSLINTLMRLSEIDSDFSHATTDPLATMFALQQYMKTVTALQTAFENIGKVYAGVGVRLPAGLPGASFVNVIADITPAAGGK